MKTLSQLALVGLVAFAFGSTALVGQSAYAQSGKASVDVYNFWKTQGWQKNAQHQARSLYYYGQTPQPISPPQAKEHATAVRESIVASQKSLGELKKSNPDNKEAQAAIAKIGEIHAKVLGHCDMLDKSLGKTDTAEMCACCADIHHDLEGADAEMTKLMKALKIEKLDLPKRDSQPAAPAKK
ncbi:MAG: hypothetical protein SFV23_07855 [Planctomycetaceae bacterium]|nr:hypothetical protein [Planctomycetaceae bacterium]